MDTQNMTTPRAAAIPRYWVKDSYELGKFKPLDDARCIEVVKAKDHAQALAQQRAAAFKAVADECSRQAEFCPPGDVHDAYVYIAYWCALSIQEQQAPDAEDGT